MHAEHLQIAILHICKCERHLEVLFVIETEVESLLFVLQNLSNHLQ